MADRLTVVNSAPNRPPKVQSPTPGGPLSRPLGAAQSIIRQLGVPKLLGGTKIGGRQQQAIFVPPDVPRDRTAEDAVPKQVAKAFKNSKGSAMDYITTFASALEQASWATNRQQEQDQKQSKRSVFAKFWKR